ncbi:hypothetical protein K488DRAFT_89258 [Vararia minispora EC-137]|uniref:Uncharacterized protein n=1 Tax=Vararia minispora EC-137 TaxID=1314806 RepID=A0ACB8QB23_9AGAM|nr:hypothetical protein K488DRAFT_89258 [Vararia minispora EC-137]
MKASAILTLAFPRPSLRPHLASPSRRPLANDPSRSVSPKASRGVTSIVRSFAKAVSKLKPSRIKDPYNRPVTCAATCHFDNLNFDEVASSAVQTITASSIYTTATERSDGGWSSSTQEPLSPMIFASDPSAAPISASTSTLVQGDLSVLFPLESAASDLVAHIGHVGHNHRIIRRRKRISFSSFGIPRPSRRALPDVNTQPPRSIIEVSLVSSVSVSFVTARTSMSTSPSEMSFSFEDAIIYPSKLTGISSAAIAFAATPEGPWPDPPPSSMASIVPSTTTVPVIGILHPPLCSTTSGVVVYGQNPEVVSNLNEKDDFPKGKSGLHLGIPIQTPLEVKLLARLHIIAPLQTVSASSVRLGQVLATHPPEWHISSTSSGSSARRSRSAFAVVTIKAVTLLSPARSEENVMCKS